MSKASREFRAERKEYNRKFPDSAYTRKEMTLKNYRENRRGFKSIRLMMKRLDNNETIR